jgi:hypothetical protein
MNKPAKFSILMALTLALLSGFVSVPRATAQTTNQTSPDTPHEDLQPSAQRIGPTLDRSLHRDRFLENLRRPIGFSIGAYHFYTPDALISSSGKESAEFTSITPRLFAHIHGKKSELHLDYTFGHRMYVRRGNLNSSDHSASLNFQRYLTRRSSLLISDSFQSGFNDEGVTSSNSIGTPLIDDQAGFNSETYFKRQRLISNTSTAGVSVQTGRKSNVHILLGHNYRRYNGEHFDTQDLLAGIGGSYQLNKWMSFESNFTTYLKTAGKSAQRVNIQRLQIVGLRYQTKSKIEFLSSGGLEYTRYSGASKAAVGIQAGVSKTSNSMHLTVVYHNGFTSAFGQGAVLNGHNVLAAVDQKLSRRISYQTGLNITQAKSFAKDGALRTRTANAGLSIVLQSHTVANVSASYISQHSGSIFANSPSIDRYTIAAGIQYYLPSLLGK